MTAENIHAEKVCKICGESFLLQEPRLHYGFAGQDIYEHETRGGCVDALKSRCAELEREKLEWIAANGPGGWIDELREENRRLKHAYEVELLANQKRGDRVSHEPFGLQDSAQEVVDAYTRRFAGADGRFYGPIDEYVEDLAEKLKDKSLETGGVQS